MFKAASYATALLKYLWLKSIIEYSWPSQIWTPVGLKAVQISWMFRFVKYTKYSCSYFQALHTPIFFKLYYMPLGSYTMKNMKEFWKCLLHYRTQLWPSPSKRAYSLLAHIFLYLALIGASLSKPHTSESLQRNSIFGTVVRPTVSRILRTNLNVLNYAIFGRIVPRLPESCKLLYYPASLDKVIIEQIQWIIGDIIEFVRLWMRIDRTHYLGYSGLKANWVTKTRPFEVIETKFNLCP